MGKGSLFGGKGVCVLEGKISVFVGEWGVFCGEVCSIVKKVRC